ncbi:MAG: protein-disulfide reductase DsbD domain-containing protein, partial [Spirochaetota bacterium]
MMRTLALLGLLLVSEGLSAATTPVQARLIAETSSVGAGQAFWAALLLDVEQGWHVYGERPGDTGLPTTLVWDLPLGFTAEPALFPPTRRYVDSGIVSQGMEGQVLILSRLHAPATLPAGATLKIKAIAGWLACKESCIPGKASLELGLGLSPGRVGLPASTIEAANQSDLALIKAALALASPDASPARIASAAPETPVVPSIGILAALALALLGGLLLNLMPCVLPVLSLKITGLLKRSGEKPGESLRQGLAYAAGILVAFEALATLLLVLKAGGSYIGWGFQFQNPTVVALSSWLFFMIALNLFGVFEFGLRIAGISGNAGAAMGSRRGGRGLAFAEGFLATFAATPCTAPFMGA